MAPPTPMQQMQERATNLDYNRLYAQPNQQPMQQPMMGYAPGGLAGNNLLGAAAGQAFNAINNNQPNTTGGTVVGQGGQYFIKDAQGGYSQPYSTALDAYYANKGQATNPTTGATVQPFTPNTSGGFDVNPFGEDTRGQGVAPQPMGDINPLTGMPIGTGPADAGPPL